MPLRRLLILTAAGLLLTPGLAAAGVSAGTPFPTNLLTTPDATQITGLRVDLPKPDCVTHPSDCADVTVLDRLDGFNVQPRLSIRFTGPIDPSSVSSDTVHLYDLGCLACAPIGIDQAVWEPAATTLHAESAALLAQHETYLLVATTGLRSADGAPLDRSAFLRDLNFGQTKDTQAKEYRTALRDALHATGTFTDAATASLFTTQSITADLDKIRAQLSASAPAPPRVTASFARAQITAIVWNRQSSTSGSLSPSFVPVPALDVFPGSVGRVVFGTYESPDYETSARVIPATGTLTGTPSPQGSEHDRLHAVPPVGGRAAERVAGGDLRPRLHGLEARGALGGRVVARPRGDRLDRDQRRRSRRRRRRQPDDPHPERSHRDPRRRARIRPGRQRHDRLDRRRRAPLRRTRSSAIVTACARR